LFCFLKKIQINKICLSAIYSVSGELQYSVGEGCWLFITPTTLAKQCCQLLAKLLGQIKQQTKNWAAGISTNKHRHLREHMCAVLPRGQNFGGKTQKGPKKIVWGRENLGPNI
jgi:hypothetical protein